MTPWTFFSQKRNEGDTLRPSCSPHSSGCHREPPLSTHLVSQTRGPDEHHSSPRSSRTHRTTPFISRSSWLPDCSRTSLCLSVYQVTIHKCFERPVYPDSRWCQCSGPWSGRWVDVSGPSPVAPVVDLGFEEKRWWEEWGKCTIVLTQNLNSFFFLLF